jgi:hypothetical protein
LSAGAIFSRAAFLVIETGQPAASRPLDTASLWMRPSGDVAYTKRRLGSATGVAFVIRWLPAHDEYPGGVNRQRTVPESASTAIVLPYVVVTTKTSCTPPPTLTRRR